MSSAKDVTDYFGGAFAYSGKEAWANVTSIWGDLSSVWNDYNHIILSGITAGVIARYTGRRVARTENFLIPAAYAATVAWRADKPLLGNVFASVVLGLMWGVSDTFLLKLGGYVDEPTTGRRRQLPPPPPTIT